MEKLNFLIVEDDLVIGIDLKSLLISEGHNVIGTATTGLEAKDLLANRNPDFVILDIHLADAISGIEIAELIHNTYKIPYIFLTAFSDEATLAAAQEQAPWGYIVKPFQDRTLISTITIAWHNFQRVHKSNDADFKIQDLGLTKQEQIICKELLFGASYNHISRKLHISMNTLKYHVKNIYRKMNIKSRSELSRILLRA